MKNSHVRTPRTMREGEFTTGYTSGPVWRRPGFHRNDRIVMTGCVIAVVGLVFMVTQGWL